MKIIEEADKWIEKCKKNVGWHGSIGNEEWDVYKFARHLDEKYELVEKRLCENFDSGSLAECKGCGETDVTRGLMFSDREKENHKPEVEVKKTGGHCKNELCECNQPEVEKCTNKSHRYLNAETGKCMKCEKEPEVQQGDLTELQWSHFKKLRAQGFTPKESYEIVTKEPELEKKSCKHAVEVDGDYICDECSQPSKVEKLCEDFSKELDRVCKELDIIGEPIQRGQPSKVEKKECCEECFKWGGKYGIYIFPCNNPTCPCHPQPSKCEPCGDKILHVGEATVCGDCGKLFSKPSSELPELPEEIEWEAGDKFPQNIVKVVKTINATIRYLEALNKKNHDN